MSRKRFLGLSEAQEDALGQIAMNNDAGHHPRTLQVLEEKGLILSWPERLPGWPPVTVRRYRVPLRVHMLWCQYCADNFPVSATDEPSGGSET